MPDLFICTDALKPTNHAVEQCYSFGPGPVYSQVLIDSARDGESGSLLAASNTRAVFQFGGNYYKMLNRQQAPTGTVICESTDSGATWAVLDSANSPLFLAMSGYFDGVSTVYCAFRNGASGSPIALQNFDLTTGLWGAVYGLAGAPNAFGANVAIWKRSNNTLLCIYQSRNTFNPGDPSGIGGVTYDLTGGSWGAPFDIGANVIALPSWDSTQSIILPEGSPASTGVMDSTGIVHLFFSATSTQLVPVIWPNRCFYQQVNLNDSLGHFFDFPGQSVLVGGKQELVAFSGSPMGVPVIVGSFIVLPVSQTNRQIATPDAFPRWLGNVYLGTPVANPVWSIDSTQTIDPGPIVDDTIEIDEAPVAVSDGSTIWALYTASGGDPNDFNFHRLRLCQTVNLGNPALGWTAVTAYDLDAAAPPFRFNTQALTLVSLFTPSGGPPPTPVVPSCNNPPSGIVGDVYTHTFTASGGTAPYTYAVTAGTLPPGLTLDGATGILSGTPTTVGLFSFTITATDSLLATGSVACSIQIYGSILIQLIGWKLYPDSPCEDAVEGIEASKVDRAV